MVLWSSNTGRKNQTAPWERRSSMVGTGSKTSRTTTPPPSSSDLLRRIDFGRPIPGYPILWRSKRVGYRCFRRHEAILSTLAPKSRIIRRHTMLTTTAPKKKTAKGRFGPYGGRYVPETLMAALQELEAAYAEARRDKSFKQEYLHLLHTYAGRPTPLFFAERLTKALQGARIYLKREDLLHTGAHKINNCIGQALLARRMGKHRIIAETGAGQHGVATATVCALFGLECVVYMGAEDMRRQELNVFRMRLLGAEVRSVDSGSRTLKDAINEAMRDWVTNVRTTHYLLGSVLGAHPYPAMVRDFHRVIGEEARKQSLTPQGKLPAAIIACVGGGSNAIGIFHAFLNDPGVALLRLQPRR